MAFFIVGLPYSASFIDNIKKTGLPFVIVGVGKLSSTAPVTVMWLIAAAFPMKWATEN